MKRYILTISIVFTCLLLATSCRTRRGGSSSSSSKGGTLGNGGIGSGFDPSGVINLGGTELGNWTFEGGYDQSGRYVGAGGMYDKNSNYVGDMGGYDQAGNWVGEKGMFNSKGDWAGPGGGYDKNRNFVGIGGMYDKNGNYVGLQNPLGGGLLSEGAREPRQFAPGTNFRSDASVGISPVYFGYDQDTIPFSEYGAMDSVVRRLASSNERLLVEGHCDERGSKPYNLALGERRAQAVRTYLISQGIAPNRITTTSYGSEKPASPGHNEGAWRQNRRVNFQFN